MCLNPPPPPPPSSSCPPPSFHALLSLVRSSRQLPYRNQYRCRPFRALLCHFFRNLLSSFVTHARVRLSCPHHEHDGIGSADRPPRHASLRIVHAFPPPTRWITRACLRNVREQNFSVVPISPAKWGRGGGRRQQGRTRPPQTHHPARRRCVVQRVVVHFVSWLLRPVGSLDCCCRC
jgi:hypothetical protein